MKRKLLICVASVLFLALLIFFVWYVNTGQYYDQPCDFPPLICIDGIKFKGTGRSISQLPPDSIYLGDVVSSVPSSKAPSENFQANSDIVGSKIYQSDNSVLIYHNQQWWIYDQLYETSSTKGTAK